MSYEIDTLDVTFKAAGNLSAYQYCFVKLSADNTVDICGDGEQPIGILQNKPSAAGQAARVRVMGVSRIIGGTAISYGDKVGSGALGVSKPVTANKGIYMGICIEGTGTIVTNEFGTVLLVGVCVLSA